MTNTKYIEKLLRVKYFEHEVETQDEEVPLLFMVRYGQLKRWGHKLYTFLTFTNVSMVSVAAQKQQEKRYQEQLLGALGHEQLTPLIPMISLTKFCENKLAKMRGCNEMAPGNKKRKRKAKNFVS